MIFGTAYGVALNDRDQMARLAPQLTDAPYQAPPVAPVVYIKPRNCFLANGAPIRLDRDVGEVALGATLGVIFGRDATRIAPEVALAAIGAACLAVDVYVPHDSFFRPALAERCRDGFLPLGSLGAMPQEAVEIVTRIDGDVVHRWPLDRLVRPIATLIADLSAFMTLRAGDLLLVGLPGDAPIARRGQAATVSAGALPALSFLLEDAA